MSLPKPYYQSDKATLYCGDARAILPLIPSVSVHCVFTDPPYGHNNNNGDLIANWEKALGRGEAGEVRPIANDGPEANELFKSVLPDLRRVLMPGCCCCCCGGGGPDPQFARWSLWIDEVFNFKQMVVWDKGPMGMGWHYRRSYETVLVGEKPGAACAWFDESMRIENIIRPGDHGIRKIIPNKRQHPTEKPWQLAAHFIRLHSREGDAVLDPFAGHGTTGEASLKMGRRFIGIELNDDFAKEAARRLAEAEKAGAMFDAPAKNEQLELCAVKP